MGSPKLCLEPALVEEAVFQWFHRGARVEPVNDSSDSRGPAADERRWNREREEVYLLPAAERSATFDALSLGWFRRLGFETLIERCLERVPHVRAGVLELRLERALGPRSEGSEVFRGAPGLRLEIAVTAARFADPARLERFLVHELLRAEDMLDPAFAYRAELGPDLVRGDPRTELVRDRLRTLWELRLAGRTARLLDREHEDPDPRRLRRAFAGRGDDELAELAARVVHGDLARFPELLEFARSELARAE
jgi:hypothetical protein